MSKDFYSPGEILFKRDEILWILQHIELIEQGIWPPDFKTTGYTGGKRNRRFGRAYFEIPLTIGAEVKRRIEAAGEDGKLLFWQVKAGVTTFEDLESEAQCALNFMSLWDFRRRPKYGVWRQNWRYYQKIKRKGN